MSRDTASPSPPINVLVAVAVGLKLVLHLATAERYGIFRDELYFLACADHLDWGYVDQPPLIAWIGAAVRALAGDSLLALRFLPAVAGALKIWLAARMARALGAGPYGQGLAAVATLIAPVFLGVDHLFTMNALDQLLWAAACLALIHIVREDRPRLWLVFGVLAGIGLLNKLSILFLGVGVGAAALLTRRWRDVPWMVAGGALAALLVSPYLLWNAAHGWPTIEFFAEYGKNKTFPVSPLQFLLQQILTIHPFTLPLWLAGLVYFARDRERRGLRMLALVYVTVFALLILQRAKFYMLSPLYPLLFAGGGLVVERITSRWARATIVVVLLAGGLLTLPEVLPVLTQEGYIRYSGMLGLKEQTRSERRELAALPQHYADMHGWEELADTVARVYAALPEAERATAVVLTGNYGQAGALDFFRRGRSLPPVYSGHNAYHAWGPPPESGDPTISVGVPEDGLLRLFTETRPVAKLSCRYCMPDEATLPVFVSRGRRRPWADVWPATKHFD